MSRAALTKLFILVILTFIICLPEFFTLYRVSKVNFFCLPYRPCERGNQVRKGANGKIGDAEIKRTDMCDPSQAEERGKWEQACTQGNQSNMTDPVSDSESGHDDSEKSWFMCQTDMDMAELHNINSSSDEWWCIFRVLWLVLLCVVLLTIVTTVLGQIYLDKRSCKKPTKSPVCNLTGQQFKDGKKHTEIITPKGEDLHFYRSRLWSELSPIEEADSQEDLETLLDGNIDHCYTANLHHRGHPSTSSLTEEQPVERSTEMDLK
ncbi:uncharacterized protein LOC111231455 isoform X2 [Seriola dumerili]|uniref:uncharacterized protein LOC111231455 isoform X2 n=1 Tax=Seriola dumerili TaxID=41447 RepID=UPI000BBEA62E|nr:uncharacterized protein LOC111231455 isoform X2 [Seriola dumerili]